MYVYVYVYIYVYVYAYVYVYVYVKVYVYVLVYMYMCMCMYTYMHIVIYIYIVLQTLYIYSSVYNIYMYNVYVFGNFDILILQMRITHECIQVQLGPVVDGCPEWPCTPVNASGSDPWKKRGRKIGTRMEVS